MSTLQCQTTKNQENYFLSQPHQPFFTLGIVNSVLFMLVFVLSYKGVFSLHVSVPFFHAYSLIFLVFANFFIGFLFTTFPRFTQGEVIKKDFYVNLFYANTLGAFLFMIGVFTTEILVVFAMILLFVAQIFMVLKFRDIYANSRSQNKKDPFWILNAQYFGLVGHLFFIASILGLLKLDIAIGISFYMYLIFLTFSVAQRMIPFFSHSLEPKDEKFISTVFILFLVKTGLVILQDVSYIKALEIAIDLIIAIYTIKEFLRWKLPMFSSSAILWVLHLGLFWLPVAFFMSAISNVLEIFLHVNMYFLSIHLLALGFLTTIFIGFGTRVVLGHSGQPPHASTFERNVFLSVQLIVVLRALYSVSIAFSWNLNFLFDIAFAIWLLVFIIWGYRYGKILIFKK